ncbi:hypothetical protein C0J52_05256 [Blattella germanica]|nr:hypothetical protein C0J52_05256 [Blattella germanica]
MDNDVTPVYLAAQEGHLEVLKFLVTQAGGSLYVRAKDGMAPVHAASQMGCLSCLKWMIQEQGVDPNLRDGDGATPLHFAASRGHVDTVRWLLRHGARLVLDKFGKSPINDAAENQQLECLSCCAGAGSREPFFLHPPTLHRAVQPDGLYINPAHSHGNTNDPFFLHNPREVVYNRVKDLFEPQPLQQQQTVAVKVEVHSGSSDENLSSSDLSERSADPENDYEEIYQSRDTATTAVRRRSRDSGSHSRSGSSSSSNSHMVVTAPPPPPNDNNEEPSTTVSTESGVSSGSPSDLGHSEEECEKTKVSHRHSLPHLQHSTNNSRALKRVVSEPGAMCPPPPPPPPPAEECSSTPPSPNHRSRSPSPSSTSTALEVVEEPTLKPSEVVQRGGSVLKPASSSQSLAQHLVNKQMVLPFVPPRFPSSNGDSNSLIKPSEYLRSLRPADEVAPQTEQQQQQLPPPQQPPSPPLPPPAATTDAPAPPPLPEEPEPTPVKQPLGAISIQDLHSVQLRKTSDKMQAPPPPKHTVEQPFLAQKEDLIAELKMSKDITGIKKLKVERAKVEEQHEKEMFTEITKQLTANSFIPDKDSTGNPIPAWKRQMLAKKAAERARKELEEQMLKEAEEKRLQAIPPWKRQLLAKKEDDSRKTNLYTPRVVEDKKQKPSKPEEILRQQIPSNSEIDNNKENKTPATQQEKDPQTQTPVKEEPKEEPEQIIPWRAQLRKTNSKLSLLE